MGATEPRPIEVLGEAEAAGCFALSAEAGWNQTADDWRLFAGRGTLFGVRDEAGRVIATAALLPYGGGAAWISMVLVTKSWQRRGLATALMGRCIAEADRVGWQTWLDATPAGATVYVPLGFQPVCDLVRVRRPPSRNAAADPSPAGEGRVGEADRGGAGPAGDPHPARAAARIRPPLQGRDRGGALVTLFARDREALGIDRATLIGCLAARPDSILMGDERACCLVRAGRAARHIGPVYGRDTNAAVRLVEQVAAVEPGELILDVYANAAPLRAALERLGFSGERPFTRMRRGRGAGRAPLPALALAGAGPEYG